VLLRLNRHDVCNMQYTSGTTGFPKGVMLTHYNVINNGKCIGDCMDLSTADRMLIPGSDVPLLWNGAFNDSLCDSWFHNVSDTVFFTEGGFGLY